MLLKFIVTLRLGKTVPFIYKIMVRLLDQILGTGKKSKKQKNIKKITISSLYSQDMV